MNGADHETRESGPVSDVDETRGTEPVGSADETSGEPPPRHEPGEPARRRLYKEPEEKKLTGVCGGLADYIGADPTIVRLAVVVVTLATGAAGVIGYLVAAVVMPRRPPTVPRVQAPRAAIPSSLTPHLWFALLICAVVLLGFEDRWWFDAPLIGLALIGVGVWFLLHDDEDEPQLAGASDSSAGDSSAKNDIYRENLNAVSDERTTLLVEVAPEGAHAGPPASEDTSGTTTHKTEDEPQPVPVPPESSSSVPEDSAHRAGPQGEVPPPVPPWGLGTSSASQPRPAGRQGPGSPAPFGLLLVVCGIGALLAVSGVVDVGAGTALALILVALGIGLVVGAWRGRTRSLAWLGLPVVGLLVLGDAADFPLDGGTDDREVVVDERAELDDEYELLAGKLTLDLRDLPVDDGVPANRLEDLLQDAGMRDVSLDDGDLPTLTAEVFVGELIVFVPRDMRVDIDALVSVGDIRGPDGLEEGGLHAERHFVVDREPAGDAGPVIHLDLKMGLGEIEVRRG